LEVKKSSKGSGTYPIQVRVEICDERGSALFFPSRFVAGAWREPLALARYWMRRGCVVFVDSAAGGRRKRFKPRTSPAKID
jgi:hypothetical protein